jgi:hypothetical protein
MGRSEQLLRDLPSPWQVKSSDGFLVATRGDVSFGALRICRQCHGTNARQHEVALQLQWAAGLRCLGSLYPCLSNAPGHQQKDRDLTHWACERVTWKPC